LSKQGVVEPLTPELALVDPELARLARDRLPDGGGAPSWSISTASVGAEAPPMLDAATTDREPRAPRRTRRGRHVMLAALVVVLAMAAIYAFAPPSTVSDEFPGRAQKAGPTRADRQTRAQAPTKRPKKSAGVGAAKVSHPSTSPTRPKTTRAKSKQPSASTSRLFIWPAVSHATFYKVEFFRRGNRVFQALASKPQLELPLRWVYGGRSYRLLAGVYSWRVSPAFGPRARLRFGDPIVRSTWTARLR
jgi:hypothetical protein